MRSISYKLQQLKPTILQELCGFFLMTNVLIVGCFGQKCLLNALNVNVWWLLKFFAGSVNSCRINHYVQCWCSPCHPCLEKINSSSTAQQEVTIITCCPRGTETEPTGGCGGRSTDFQMWTQAVVTVVLWQQSFKVGGLAAAKQKKVCVLLSL